MTGQLGGAICEVLRWVNGVGAGVLVVIMLARHRRWAALPVWLRFYANGLMMMTLAAGYGSFEALYLELGPAFRVPITTIALGWVAVGVFFPRDREPYADRRAKD